METINKDQSQKADMALLSSFLRINISRISNKCWRIDKFQSDIPDMLLQCYGAECISRGFDIVVDNETKSNIKKVSNWLCNGKKFGLMLFGTCGNGKTTMIKAVKSLIEFLYGNPNSSDFAKLEIISALDMAKLAMTNEAEFERLKKAKLLAIDDVGAENSEVKNYGNVISPLTDILYYRYNCQMFTIISSNLDKNNIGERYGGRIADRIDEMFNGISFTNKSYRKYGKE